jgi:hypothetical protein
MPVTYTMFIQMFIPKRNPTIQMLLQVVGYHWWAQLGSNQRPPDYEYPFFDILSITKKSCYLSYI